MNKLFGIFGKLFEFISLVVIPLTIWFVVLRQDVSSQARITEDHSVQIEKIRDGISRDITSIKQDLGEIKGELKRIRK